VALAIRLEDRPGILFSQDRLGQDGATIRVSKFRSMRHNDADPTTMGRVDGAHPLVTRTGRVIRRLKLDELPQLLGVARGDLSLVGPRPTLVEHLADYDDFQRRRLTVRPGLTGWAQVNGNTSLSWDERIRLDVWYVDNWSFWLDIKILARTVLSVLVGERRNPAALEEATRHEAVARRRG
jgi:lipopolysaccharide/colanic/teichoic acid biosynthesis glycosyltransferase